MIRNNAMVLIAAALMGASTALAQQEATRVSKTTVIRAGRLIDTRGGRVLTDQHIVIEGERVKRVGPAGEIEVPAGADQIDLTGATVLPGLIDAHTHVLLQGDITQADYDEQLLKESIPYRTIRATVAAKTALLNGFTAIRDLETEGAMYADVDLKRAIERGIIPGPRMFVSTRAFSATGMYPLLGLLMGAQGSRRGADRGRPGRDSQGRARAGQVRSRLDQVLFRPQITTSRTASCAARSISRPRRSRRSSTRLIAWIGAWPLMPWDVTASCAALKAGVDSIEHGDGLDDETIDLMVQKGVYWCPTIYVGAYVAEGRAAAGAPVWKAMVELERQAFGLAVKKGVKIAFGTDAGGYAWTENQAKEFAYMVRYGQTPMQAIQSATTVAAELLQAEKDLGAIEPGKFADIVAAQRQSPGKDRRARACRVRDEGRESRSQRADPPQVRRTVLGEKQP